MGIVNKRNALVGWAAIKMGKKVARKKAADLVPGTVDDSKRPNKSALAILLASLGGVLVFWRKRSGDDESTAS
jgi:hypothetical protein